MSGAAREALRQQMLLRALLGDSRPGVVIGWLRDGARAERGLAAYRANAGAAAERALAAAFPTVQQLVGDESFAALARAFWHRRPPQAGDLGVWGAELAGFIADAESLAGEPYLPDVAQLDWAVHLAERAADASAGRLADGSTIPGLALLASADPDAIRFELAPGSAVLASAHPVVSIRAAHARSEAERFAPVRAAFAAGLGECALVVRCGLRAEVFSITPVEAAFTQALIDGCSLGAALQRVPPHQGADERDAAPSFDFEAWLLKALREQRLSAVLPLRTQESA